jgi:N,N'-diacetyllegionaminate synthase
MNKKKIIKINNKIIDEKSNTYVIAEIGINHLGDKNLCIRQINSAIKCGADAVKLQIADYEDSYSKNTQSYKIFKKYSLNLDNLIKINNYCKKKNITIFATPSGKSVIKIIKKLKYPAIKISSSLLNNVYFINQISSEIKKPFILSCGMALEKEIREATNILKEKKIPFILLKCTSLYPAQDKSLNLYSIKTLENKFDCIIGYSDHTKDNLACLSAVAMGAKVIEKHFNTEKNTKAPDDKISAKPKQFSKLISDIRRIEEMKGRSTIYPDKKEIVLRKFNQRKIISKKEILLEQEFNEENIGLLRSKKPIIGLSAKFFNKFLNQKSSRKIKKNTILNLKHILK